MKTKKLISIVLCSAILFTGNVFADTKIGTWVIENKSSVKLVPNSDYIQAPAGCVTVSKGVIVSNSNRTLTVSTPDSSTNCPSTYDFSIFYLYSNNDGTSTNCQFYATMKKDSSGKYNVFPNSNLASTCMGTTSKISITPGGEKDYLSYLVTDASK